MEHLNADLARLLAHGQMPPTDRARWEAHLDQCDECRAILAREKSWVRLLSLGDTANVPAGGAERLLEQLDGLPVRASKRKSAWPWAVGGLFVGVAAQVMPANRPAETGPTEADLARQLGLTTISQRRVIESIPALDALRADPWLADEYDTLKTLADQILVRSDSHQTGH